MAIWKRFFLFFGEPIFLSSFYFSNISDTVTKITQSNKAESAALATTKSPADQDFMIDQRPLKNIWTRSLLSYIPYDDQNSIENKLDMVTHDVFALQTSCFVVD